MEEEGKRRKCGKEREKKPLKSVKKKLANSCELKKRSLLDFAIFGTVRYSHLWSNKQVTNSFKMT